MTLLQTQLVAKLAHEYPTAVAWRNLADGAELTLGQWHLLSNRLARGLKERGLHRGDRVGLLIGNEEPLEWLVSYLAIHKAGAVAVPLLTRLGPSETARILSHAGTSVVLCSDVRAEVRAAVPTVVSTTGGGSVGWEDLLAQDDSDVPEVLGPDDVADIMYTSGTTGQPKGVVVRHGGLSTMEHVPSAWIGLGFISCSPFATTSGSLLVCGPLRGGLSGWFLPRFDPDRWIDAVERDRPVAGFLVPAMVELIVGSPRFEAADLSSLAVVNIGSAPDCRGDLASLRHGVADCGGPVRVRDDGVRRRHRHAVGGRREAPRVGRRPLARRRAPDRRLGRRGRAAGCGRTSGHRRDATPAGIPRRP